MHTAEPAASRKRNHSDKTVRETILRLIQASLWHQEANTRPPPSLPAVNIPRLSLISHLTNHVIDIQHIMLLHVPFVMNLNGHIPSISPIGPQMYRHRVWRIEHHHIIFVSV